MDNSQAQATLIIRFVLNEKRNKCQRVVSQYYHYSEIKAMLTNPYYQ